jgi:hypothetical protein
LKIAEVMAAMSNGSILLVHGTGVRLANYSKSFQIAEATAADCSIKRKLLPCAWGDQFGVEFNGDSLPDPPTPEVVEKEKADFAYWAWILDDPLFELGTLTIRDSKTKPKMMAPPAGKAAWELGLEKAKNYEPTDEFRQLLVRANLEDFWPHAFERVISDPITTNAFKASEHELPEAFRALARALVAQLHVEAISKSSPGPDATLREKMVARLRLDWEQQVFGLSTVFFELVARAGTRYMRGRRNALNAAAALPLGDVLLYQTIGADIRSFIKMKIEKATPPVTVVAHSLGGIASVDLLALEKIQQVQGLVTLGSQSPFMYEIGSLFSLKRGQKLRADFPPWLNIFDRNDFLSFFASRVFPRQVVDFEVSSGQPFPESHSAYYGSEAVWTQIRKFIGEGD